MSLASHRRRVPSSVGFTLIEVVVALAILASTLYGGFFLLNRTTINTYHLRDTVLANWVASNAYANSVLMDSFPDRAPLLSEEVLMYGEEFLLTLRIEGERGTNTDNAPESDTETKAEASNQEKQTLTITVAKSSAPGLPLENLVVYQ